jgi:hypothetical protein
VSTVSLSFMGTCEPETFRARVYGADAPDERVVLLWRLAHEGVLDGPAWDPWINALARRGWLAEPEREPADGGGHHLRWRLGETGRAALARVYGRVA